MDQVEVVILQGLRLAGEGSSEEVSSDCTGVVCRKEVLPRGRSLIWGFVRFQQLLRESVDLVGASNFMGQQR